MKIGHLRPLTPGMASIGNQTPPPAPAQTDIETRFLAVNRDKLRRLYDNLTQRQCDFLDVLPHGLAVTPPDVLFAKIEDEQVEEWKARFGGEG